MELPDAVLKIGAPGKGKDFQKDFFYRLVGLMKGESMTYTISDQALSKTNRCPYDFACLNPASLGDKPMCEVRDADGQDILFLKTKEAATCPYRLPFGYEQVCSCPTHYAIITTCQ